ncbi:MAG: hypothetical protein GX268_09110 [Methanomicrobiales archaeon]|jgi:hypothetical protein|nr:hypothetical protein [Methanomicrobiales archaeon]
MIPLARGYGYTSGCGDIMVAPIELGYTLKDQDLKDFDNYLRDPTCTPKGLKLFEEAEELANKW